MQYFIFKSDSDQAGDKPASLVPILPEVPSHPSEMTHPTAGAVGAALTASEGLLGTRHLLRHRILDGATHSAIDAEDFEGALDHCTASLPGYNYLYGGHHPPGSGPSGRPFGPQGTKPTPMKLTKVSTMGTSRWVGRWASAHDDAG